MRDFLQLAINGELLRVAGGEVFWTLSDFLRRERGLVGTKIVCAEGDCGACSVLVGWPAADGRSFDYRAIDACIVFLHQLDCTHIVTVEGLADPSGRLTAVQRAMVDCHGSQCGFCTPGFVVAMHGLFEEHDTPSDDAEPLPEDTLRIGLSGNLCRCTGYVQILEAGRSLAVDGVASMHERFPPRELLREFVALRDAEVLVESEARQVFVPRTLDQALRFKAEHQDARVVSGATDLGVQHNHDCPRAPVSMCLSSVTELTQITSHPDELRLGAAATWAQILESVREPFAELAAIIERFGSPQIRNIGTIGGNLANASPIADSIPFLYAIDAQLELVSIRGSRTVGIRDFYRGYKELDLAADELIAAVACPRLRPGQRLKLYKVSRRRDMDISTFTAAILLTMRDEQIEQASVALGGVGPTVIHAVAAEAALVGQPFCIDTLRAAGLAARSEITPISDVRGTDRYRGQLAENIFLRCYHDLSAGPEVVPS